MGKNLSKKKKEEEEKRERQRKIEKEREEEDRLYEEQLQREYEEKVKEYKDFISKYEELVESEIEYNVELNEPFIIKGSRPYSVPPSARKKEFKLIKMDDNFELVEQRNFKLQRPHTYGGSITVIYVFRPIKKGKGQIIFTKFLKNITIN